MSGTSSAHVFSIAEGICFLPLVASNNHYTLIGAKAVNGDAGAFKHLPIAMV